MFTAFMFFFVVFVVFCWSVVVQYEYKHIQLSSYVNLASSGTGGKCEIKREEKQTVGREGLALGKEVTHLHYIRWCARLTSMNAWSTPSKSWTQVDCIRRRIAPRRNIRVHEGAHTTTSADAAGVPRAAASSSLLDIHTHMSRLFKCGRPLRGGERKEYVEGERRREVGGWNSLRWLASPDSTPSVYTLVRESRRPSRISGVQKPTPVTCFSLPQYIPPHATSERISFKISNFNPEGATILGVDLDTIHIGEHRPTCLCVGPSAA